MKQQKQTIPDLSHQIRNRLTCIMLGTDILRFKLQRFLSEEQRDEFHKINIAAEEIRRRLEDLLDLAGLGKLAESHVSGKGTDRPIGT